MSYQYRRGDPNIQDARDLRADLQYRETRDPINSPPGSETRLETAGEASQTHNPAEFEMEHQGHQTPGDPVHEPTTQAITDALNAIIG